MKSVRSINGNAVGFAFRMYFLALRICVILRVLGSGGIILVVEVAIMRLVFAIFYFAFLIFCPPHFWCGFGSGKVGGKISKSYNCSENSKMLLNNVLQNPKILRKILA